MSVDDWTFSLLRNEQPSSLPRRNETHRTLDDDAAERETVLGRAVRLLATHPRSPSGLLSGERFISSVPVTSQITGQVLRAAVCTAHRSYGGDVPLGPQLSADRIQRLILGIAELLQIELLTTPGCDFDHLDAELLASLKCLRAGFQAETDDEAPLDVSSDDDEDDE